MSRQEVTEVNDGTSRMVSFIFPLLSFLFYLYSFIFTLLSLLFYLYSFIFTLLKFVPYVEYGIGWGRCRVF